MVGGTLVPYREGIRCAQAKLSEPDPITVTARVMNVDGCRCLEAVRTASVSEPDSDTGSGSLTLAVRMGHHDSRNPL